MTLFQALGLGILQGVTEFLPISSSGHLVLAQNLWPGLVGPHLLFDVAVHLGTIGAIVWILRRRIARLWHAMLGLLRAGPRGLASDERWIGLILVATIPTALIGLALRDVVVAMQARVVEVGAALVATALLLVLAERTGRRSREAPSLGWLDAVLVGAAQGLAVIPGISRSGATIATALARGSKAEVAVEFSMLISIPAVLGASLLEGAHLGWTAIRAQAAPLLVGFVSALIAGGLSLKLLQWVVSRRLLLPFAVYCLVVGVGALSFG